MFAIETDKLTKYYGKSRGIVEVDMKVKEGEVFAFIGPNGAGKSTFIRTILNLIHPTSGKAIVLGKDITKDGKEIRKHIGYLPSEVNYYETMTAIQVLNYSKDFYGIKDTKRIKELAEIFQLDLSKKVKSLSLGNRKKVGIIQTLLHDPKLLILDEPTSGLDPLMQNKLFDIILEEQKKGKTIFFSTHVLSEVNKVCDRLALIKDGKIIKVENVEDINKNTFKILNVTFSKKVDRELFKDLDISKVEGEGQHFRLYFNGTVNEIIKRFIDIEIKNIRIEEPSLEDVFMEYYK